jgi:hypothetical protein
MITDSKIITLHDISGDPILVNLDKINFARQAENCCVIYLSDSYSVKVSETLNDIGKFVDARKYIG